MLTSGDDASSVACRLLLKVIYNLEEVKRTQAIHSNLLQTQVRRAGGELNGATEIPEGLSFPLVTIAHVDDAEEKLKNLATKCALVGHLFAVLNLARLTDLYLLLACID